MPSFKILGASWGSFRAVASKLGLELDAGIDAVRDKANGSGIVLYAATDGNHGRAVAKMGAILDVATEIHVPATMDPSTIEFIRSEGATIVISEGSYDDAVLEAQTASQHENGILIQDYAFGDYYHLPQVAQVPYPIPLPTHRRSPLLNINHLPVDRRRLHDHDA